MQTIVEIRAKAFAQGSIQHVQCMVSEDGLVRVFDHIAGFFTACHSLSAEDCARVRKLAEAERTTNAPPL